MSDEDRWVAIGADPSGKFVFKEVNDAEINDMWGMDDNIAYLNPDLFEMLKEAMGGEDPKPRQHRIACYMRVDPEEGEEQLMSYDEAKEEIESLKLMQPENEYRIELVEDDDEAE